jgi:hypothetical protein
MARDTLFLLRRGDQPLLLDAVGGAPSEPARIGVAILKPFFEGFPLADLLFAIDLPDDFRIRPADWRSVAYDHDAVGKLTVETLAQNAHALQCEPFTPALMQRAGELLRRALDDLVTVFDIKDVTCEASDNGRLIATAIGEHKNGHTNTYSVSVDRSY